MVHWSASLFVVVTSVCIIWFYVYKFQWETFLDNENTFIFNDEVQDVYLRKDNKACDIIIDNPDGLQNNDIIRNHRLLSLPSKPSTSCYFKMSDALVNNRCSKLNPNLYRNDKHASIVKSIEPELLTEDYQSKIVHSDVCAIEFHENRENRMDYLRFLSDNDPKVQGLKRELDQTVQSNERENTFIQELSAKEQNILFEQVPAINTEISNTIAANERGIPMDRQAEEKVRKNENELQFWKTRPHILEQNKSLLPGQCLLGVSGHRFCFERDGNIAWYNARNQAIWTNVRTSSPRELKLQDDGNLVAYDTFGRVFWQTNTSRNRFRWFFGLQQHSPPYTLIVQGDGNVVLYDSRKRAIWSSKTNGK